MKLKNVVQEPEKALLVGAELWGRRTWDVESSVKELEQLADTAGAQVVGQMIAKLDRPNPATFIGKGKTEELASLCEVEGVDIVVFDDDLSPAQSRNLQDICGVRVIDRTQLILDIFSRRARTKESQLQVELAQLKYLLPRLTGQWLHLSRQVGGIGTRGPGETQLEVDRRRVKTRILKLSKEIKTISIERDVQRKKRERKDLSVISIIGYTNAGKTTLFNRLTASVNLAEDRLFATLDATVRKAPLEGSLQALFSDTVGFIRKLPHHLVESFKATLDEVVHSDLLIHVIDVSDPLASEKCEVVNDVIKDLKAENIPCMLALNKIDLLDRPERLLRWKQINDLAVPISATKGHGMDQLLMKAVSVLQERFQRLKLFIPHSDSDLVAYLHREARVLKKQFDEKGVWLDVEVPKRLLSKVERFQEIN